MPTLLIRKHSKGIDRSVPPSEIEPGSYVKLQNLRGSGDALEPRPGQKRYLNTSIGGEVTVTDLFTRGDNNSLGASWAESEGDPTAIRIVSNQLFMDSGATDFSGIATYTAVSASADQASKLTFIANGSSAAARSGPGVRMSGTNLLFTGYALLYDGTTLIIRKYVAEPVNTDFTAGVTIGSHTVTLINGDTAELRVVGTTLTVSVNGGAAVITVVDTAIATGAFGVVNNRRGAGANRSTTWDTWVGTYVGYSTDPVTGLLRAYLTGSGAATVLGPRAGGTAVDDSGVGTLAWTSPGNVFASDNIYASVAADGATHYLKITNFGFALPVGAVIAGILVEVERHDIPPSGSGGGWDPEAGGGEGGGGSVIDARVRIVKGGAIGSTDRADTGVVWPASDAFKSYGGSSDLWGETWAYTDINASSFGVAIAATVSGGSQALIDFVRITVYYYTAAPGKMTIPFTDRLYRDSGAPGAEWQTISGANVLAKGANLESLVWHNTAFFQDGANGPYKYDGTTFAVWSSAGPKTTPPIGKFMLLDVERLYIANLLNAADGGPSGIRASTRDDHDDFPLTADPSGDEGMLMKAGKDDGDYLSGVGKLGTLKFFFKRRTTYILKGDNADTWDLSTFLPYGAITHRVIQNCGNEICWTDGRRVYSYGPNGLDITFGFKVEKLLAQTPLESWQNLASAFWDGLYILWYRQDEAVAFDFRTRAWYGPWVGLPMRCAIVDRDDDTIWYGRADESYVWKLSEISDYTGAGAALGIDVVAETGAYDFQDPDWIKRARQALVRADGEWGNTTLVINGTGSQVRPFNFSGMNVQQLQQPLAPGNDSHFYGLRWTATMPTGLTARTRLYMLGLRADRVRRTFQVA